MKTTSLALVALVVGFLVTGCAPRVARLQSGSLDFLKQETVVNLDYDYSNMRVGRLSEQEYVTNRVAELNAKESGRGERWHAAWQADRANRFEPKFETLLNSHVKEGRRELRFAEDPTAKYTLILKTTMTEPGWNVGVMRSPAAIDAEAIFVETQNRRNQVAQVSITRSPGADAWGFDFDVGQRIQESYAKAGKELGKLIVKETK